MSYEPYVADPAEPRPRGRLDRWRPRVATLAVIGVVAGAALGIYNAVEPAQDPVLDLDALDPEIREQLEHEGFDPDDPALEGIEEGDFDPDFDPGAQPPLTDPEDEGLDDDEDGRADG